MTHFRVSDGACFHAKLVAAGNEAVGAWARAGSWSAAPENLTDGLIPAGVAAAIAPPKVWKRALDAGLVEARPGGAYQIHDFLDRNPSAAKVRAERDAWAERQRRSRGVSPPESQNLSRRDTPRDSRSESRRTPTVSHTAPDPDPIPDPSAPPEHVSHAREGAPPVEPPSGLVHLPAPERAPLGDLIQTLVAEGNQVGMSVSERLAKGWRPTDAQLRTLRQIHAERLAAARSPPRPSGRGRHAPQPAAQAVLDSWAEEG